jgi:hypothetical protein
MKTNDELARHLGVGLEIANQLLQRAWDEKVLRATAARELTAVLRSTVTAAEELERRANEEVDV